jgi:hypothetical protein
VHEVVKVAPGAGAYHSFDTGSGKVKKGTATVTATHWDGSLDHEITQRAEIAKAACK